MDISKVARETIQDEYCDVVAAHCTMTNTSYSLKFLRLKDFADQRTAVKKFSREISSSRQMQGMVGS